MSRNKTTIPPTPVKIRGVQYKTQREAALALGVHQSTISRAVLRGTLDNVGLDLHIGPHPKGFRVATPKPVVINGVRYGSKKIAREELGLGVIGLEDAIRKESELP